MGRGPFPAFIADSDNILLDGEWDNPISTSDPASDTFPSGDNLSGGDFNFRLDVLPGDISGNGSVSALEINLARLAQNTSFGGPGYDIRNDLNANRSVSSLEINLARVRVGGQILSLGDPPLDAFDPPTMFSVFASDNPALGKSSPTQVGDAIAVDLTPTASSFAISLRPAATKSRAGVDKWS